MEDRRKGNRFGLASRVNNRPGRLAAIGAIVIEFGKCRNGVGGTGPKAQNTPCLCPRGLWWVK